MVGLIEKLFLSNKVSEFLAQWVLIFLGFFYFYESYAFYFCTSLSILIVTISYLFSGSINLRDILKTCLKSLLLALTFYGPLIYDCLILKVLVISDYELFYGVLKKFTVW